MCGRRRHTVAPHRRRRGSAGAVISCYALAAAVVVGVWPVLIATVVPLAVCALLVVCLALVAIPLAVCAMVLASGTGALATVVTLADTARRKRAERAAGRRLPRARVWHMRCTRPGHAPDH